MIPKTEILDKLFAARDALSDAIIDMHASNQAEKSAMLELVARRDRLTAAIQTIIERAVDTAAAKLPAAVADLQKQTDALVALQKTIAKIDDAIQIADAVVGTAIQIALMVI